MARRAFVPPPTLAPDSTPRASTPPPSRSPASSGQRGSVPPPATSPSVAPRPAVGSIAPLAPAPASGMLPDARRSVPPPGLPNGNNGDVVSIAACAQLLDRLAASDQAPFIASWIESVLSGRNRTDPTLAVRLLRCYRETGRIDRARELASSLLSTPASWTPLDAARLAIERANLATIDGRADHAEAELRVAARALGSAPKGAGLREQLDMHVTQAQLEIKLDRLPGAAHALRLAEHVAERLDDVAWRAPVAMTLGHLSMRLSDPRSAARHYATALSRTQARAAASMTAHGNLAIALGSIGRFEEGRHHGSQAISIAQELAAGWRHADAHDVLAIVEIAADRPLAALQAIDEALVVLGEIDHTMLRYQLAVHRTWALAMLGRAQSAKQWLARAEKLRGDLPVVDAIDEQDLASTRARTLEACGQPREAIDEALTHAQRLPEAFVTGSLNLVVGRCALAIGDEPAARLAVERAALSGDRHGWVFPDREASLPLWQLALKSGDSRVVRYAERTMALVNAMSAETLPAPPPSRVSGARLSSSADLDSLVEPTEGETLIYVTTPERVTRVPLADMAKATEGATLVVDTLAHALRVHDREVSLERRRALEPLVVQLLRRAREGLSADEIL